jgi:hypothetical protein
MILVFPLALAAALVVLWRSRGQPQREGEGCRWFWAWSLVGAALCFSFLTGFSIGLFLLPLALLLLWLVLRLSPRFAESIGAIAGIGFVLLLVAYLNRGSNPCPASGAHVAANTPGVEMSCGGFEPHPWLCAGLLCSIAAVLAYAVVRRVSKP